MFETFVHESILNTGVPRFQGFGMRSSTICMYYYTHTCTVHVFTPCLESPCTCTKPQRHTLGQFPVSCLLPHILHTYLESQSICNKTIKTSYYTHMHWTLPTFGLMYICVLFNSACNRSTNGKFQVITHTLFSPHLACQSSYVYKQEGATKAHFLVVSDMCRQ